MTSKRIKANGTDTLQLGNGQLSINQSTGTVTVGATGFSGQHTVNGSTLFQTPSGTTTIALFRENNANVPVFSIESTTDGMKIRSTFNTGIPGKFEIQADGGSSSISFRTNNAERGSITNTGVWVLGQASPGSIAHTVNGGLSVNIGGTGTAASEIGRSVAGTTSGVLGVQKYNTTVASTRLIFGYADTGTASTIRGYIRVNATSNNLEFEGTSDRRVKTHIQDLSGSLVRLMAVRPREFEMREFPGVKCNGFVAQELHAVFPELVTTTDSGEGQDLPEGTEPWTMSEAGFTVHLVKAIQELKAELDAAEARIKQLEDR